MYQLSLHLESNVILVVMTFAKCLMICAWKSMLFLCFLWKTETGICFALFCLSWVGLPLTKHNRPYKVELQSSGPLISNRQLNEFSPLVPKNWKIPPPPLQFFIPHPFFSLSLLLLSILFLHFPSLPQLLLFPLESRKVIFS